MIIAEMINSIGNTIAIGFFGSIAIAIAKAIFQLLLLILLREFFNYCYWYCYGNLKTIAHNLLFLHRGFCL